MDKNEIISALSEMLDLPLSQVEAVMKAIGPQIRDYCADLDTVAIPGFGTFQPVRRPETITPDPATGRKMLMPPAVVVEFKSSVVLRKRLAE